MADRKNYRFTFRRMPTDCRAFQDGYPFGYDVTRDHPHSNGRGGPCKNWAEALQVWERQVERWKTQQSWEPAPMPNLRNVDFHDETGEHTVEELFGIWRLL